MDKESKEIVDTLVNLCWYMRGGLTIDKAYDTTPEERDSIMKMVKSHIETSKETGQIML